MDKEENTNVKNQFLKYEMVFGGRKPKLVVRGDKGKKHETLRFQTFRRILLLLFSHSSLDLFV